MRSRRFCAFLLFFGLAPPMGRVARAEATPSDDYDAMHTPLPPLTAAQIDSLRPLLERGPVGFVEFADDDELPAVAIAARVHALPEQVLALLRAPERYPRFMPALDDVQVRARDARSVAYEWTWRTAIFSLTGRNAMTFLPATADRGPRVDVRSTGGDLGDGRMMWRIDADGPEHSLLVFSSRMDMREGSYLPRELSVRGKTLHRTIHIALAFSILLNTVREAERVAGHVRPVRNDRPEFPELDNRAYWDLLRRGDLVWANLDTGAEPNVTTLGWVGKRAPRVWEVLSDPQELAGTLMPESYAELSDPAADGSVDFRWGVRLPLVGTSGRMRVRTEGGTVGVDATAGAMTGGRWRFTVQPSRRAGSVVVGWANFDPGDASWLIRSLVRNEPSLGIGIAAGAQVMILRAVRYRAHQPRADIELARPRREEPVLVQPVERPVPPRPPGRRRS